MPASPSAPRPVPCVGRFAPSPTGPLHFGSLVAAVASCVDARARGGRWLVRMEDLDPPREPPGAARRILEQLLAFGLRWDGRVLYQSERLAAYEAALERLAAEGLVFACGCSRAAVRRMGGVYDGSCRGRAPRGPDPLRVRVAPEEIVVDDAVQGRFRQHLEREAGDFVVRRRDGLFAYQLAAVVDDAFQGVTRVVRGADLLDSTPRQIYLQRRLGLPTPAYGHVPVAVDARGRKLSKQHLARPVDCGDPGTMVRRALEFLGQRPPPALRGAPPEEQLAWAAGRWSMRAVPKLATIAGTSAD